MFKKYIFNKAWAIKYQGVIFSRIVNKTTSGFITAMGQQLKTERDRD